MLSPYTVLDLTDDRGELASMVLGDLGASVIKVEPPEGSPSRRMGPFLEGAPEPERSLLYFAFNRNKRSITLDLTSAAGRRVLLRLVEKAGFLIESARPGEMAELGLGFDALRQVNPRLVYVAITAFGQDGPHAGFAASDLTLAAMGGQMGLHGDPDRPPVRITVPQVWLHASVEAVVGALTAHALMLQARPSSWMSPPRPPWSGRCCTPWSLTQSRAPTSTAGGPPFSSATSRSPSCTSAQTATSC
jgi:crotonobetainyl-CoA:carnitine CoA-transferase CaiB-like acyl-CoA transferase